MKKLWKDNGGYALIYVLIVVLVLCAVAVSVCTAALKNYQAQERSIRQTQQLYQAEGEIEKFVALAEAEDVKSKTVSGPCDSGDKAMAAAKEKYLEQLSAVKEKVSSCNFALDKADTGSNSCTFTLTCKNAAVRIETKIKMKLAYEVTEKEETETQPDGTSKKVIKYTAWVSKATHHYITYTITHLTAEGGTSE